MASATTIRGLCVFPVFRGVGPQVGHVHHRAGVLEPLVGVPLIESLAILPYFPIPNRHTATMPVVSGFLAFSNRNIALRLLRFGIATYAHFIGVVAVWRF